MIENYFKTDTKEIDFNNSELVSEMYSKGFVFTRLGKGVMNQTRSLRINLSKFNLNSENRRVLKKVENLHLNFHKLPLKNYSWEIHKLGKDFYSRKFGEGTMSASKIKEMFNDMNESNMNSVFRYELRVANNESNESQNALEQTHIGYALCYENNEIIHYAYPFYDLEINLPNIGIGMMLKAILFAKEQNKKYIYLGSVIDFSSKYKLQFEGLEWFDEKEKNWSEDLEKLKDLIK